MPSMREFGTWLTPSEAGKEIGISKQALYRHLSLGRLRAIDTHAGWLIDPQSVAEFAEKRAERERAAGKLIAELDQGASHP